jgi:hypothetical protein
MAAGAASITRRNDETRIGPAADFRRALTVRLDELFEPERSVGRTELCSSAIPVFRLARVGLEIDDAQTLEHDRIVSPPKGERGLRVVAVGCPA